jgi:hypothetical protein
MKFDYLKQPNFVDPQRAFIARPVIPIQLRNGDAVVQVLALVDSGADGSLFNTQLADEIGIDWRKGEYRQFTGIEGSPVDVYMSDVEIHVGGGASRIQASVGFTTSRGVGAVLGQADFFSQHKIIFDQSKERLEIIPIPPKRR